MKTRPLLVRHVNKLCYYIKIKKILLLRRTQLLWKCRNVFLCNYNINYQLNNLLQFININLKKNCINGMWKLP